MGYVDQEALKMEEYVLELRLQKIKERKREIRRELKKKPPLSLIYSTFMESKREYYKSKNKESIEHGKFACDMARDLYGVELKDLIGTEACYYVPHEFRAEFPILH